MKICKQCGSDEISVAVIRDGNTLLTTFECDDCGETAHREESLTARSKPVSEVIVQDFLEAIRSEREAVELEDDLPVDSD